MESPVGTTYELRSHSLLPASPRMTDKADSCGRLPILQQINLRTVKWAKCDKTQFGEL